MTQILLVEDDLEICEILQFYLLKQSNYNVTVAHSSKEARMLTGLRNYDLILMDIMLPDQDGLSLCEELRKTMFCPIIFISCLSDDETVIRALNMGGDDYLIRHRFFWQGSKPICAGAQGPTPGMQRPSGWERCIWTRR